MTDPQHGRPGTFDYEETLPRVPLPALADSAGEFLEWCAPLLDAEQRAATEATVEKFLAPESPAWALHDELAAYEKTEGVHSWLDEFWRRRYLGRRDRISGNANYFFLFEGGEPDQVRRAAGLVAAAVDYKQRIDAEQVPPEIHRGQPQSMQQLKHLFGTTRIPGEQLDTARTPHSEAEPGPSEARHIVVFVRGHMFRLDVLDPQGLPYTAGEIAGGLRAALAAAPGWAEPGTSVGALTTEARAEWAADRAALLAADPGNAPTLDIVETALFCLCLEDTDPRSPQEAADRLLTGEAANRWFDKAVTLIVFADGRAGLNGEHCQLDGTTMISFLEAIVDAQPWPEGSGSRTPQVEPVEFVLDEALRARIRAAGEAFAAYAADTASATVAIEGFGSERAKALKISPDAFAQLVFQLAHHRARGFVGATYESIATRGFHHGRTEAMRVITPEMLDFVAAMTDPHAETATRVAAARSAAQAHAARAKACQAGQAPEQHLWELELIQQRRGEQLGLSAPMGLYGSPGWRIMRSDYLSTSSVPSTRVSYWGFGSTSRSCIGVGYALLPGKFHLYLSTPREVAEAMYRFADELRTAVTELDRLLATG